MNSMDRRLDRLLRAAALAPAPPAEVALGTESRVLAQWRSRRAEAEDFGPVIWLRRGFALACGLTVVIAAISLTQRWQRATDVWNVSNALVNLAALP